MLWIIVIVFILFGIYVFMIFPNKKRDFARFDAYDYAHRGLYNNATNAPENSLEAFRLAVEKNYGIELDVQLTKDEIPIVFHDFTLKRVCGVEGKVCDYTYDELQQFHLFQSDATIPLFSEFLEIVDGKVPFILEYKVDGMNPRVCEIVHPMLENYNGSYVVESFNPMAMKWYKEHHPEIIRGQLSMRFMKDDHCKFSWTYFVVQNLLSNFLTRPDFIAYDYRGKSNISFKLCRLFGAKPVTWTIPSKEVYESNKNDFDLFIFEGFESQYKK